MPQSGHALTNADSLGDKALPLRLSYPGLGLVIAILFVYFTGVVLSLNGIRAWLSRAPLVGPFLFGGGKVVTAILLSRLKPCLCLVSPTRLSYGWILSEEHVRFQEELADFTIVNVYHPFVPLFVTGQVVL
jgi:hypothetical protein